MYTIILFYKYITIPRSKEILNWQMALCQKLGLKGRIILATEGINGTLGGTPAAIDTYKNAMMAHTLFADIDFKESDAKAIPFARLRVVIKNEIVNLGIDPLLLPASQTGIHVEPHEAHAMIAQKNDNLVIIDCRNQIESAIGMIEGAIRPAVNNFRDFPAYIDKNLDLIKNKQVLMYCTGGVRCERASAYIKSKGVTQEVFHIKGGIHRYVEALPDGFFKGKNYVFDGRIAVKVTDDILGNCFICQAPYDIYTNCLRAMCNRHFICCPACLDTYKNTCSSKCADLVYNHHAPKRPELDRNFSLS